MMFNAEELTSVSEDLDWTLEDCKLGGTIARSCSYLHHPPNPALFARLLRSVLPLVLSHWFWPHTVLRPLSFS